MQDEYRNITESLYMNKYLWKLGTEEALYYNEMKKVFMDGVLNECINKIKQNVTMIFPGCNIVPVGSFKDGTQVVIPNEFDILFEIPDVMSLVVHNQSDNCLQILPVNIPLTGPQQSRDIIKRTYVNLSSSHPWGQFGKENNPCLLDSSKLQSRFQRCIEEALLCHNYHVKIKLRGPAVCVFLKIQTSDLVEYASSDLQKILISLGTEIWIKIDLVLGILYRFLSREVSSRVGEAILTDNVKGINKCHLVMSGNFFQVSFCLFESETVSQHVSEDPVKRACIMSIKVNTMFTSKEV